MYQKKIIVFLMKIQKIKEKQNQTNALNKFSNNNLENSKNIFE